MLAAALTSSPTVFVTLLCLGAAACTALTLLLVRRLGLDAAYESLRSRLSLGWGTRSILSTLALSLLAMAATWLLGTVDPAAYLSPGPAAIVYSALLLAMPIHAIVMPVGRHAGQNDAQLGDAYESEDQHRQAA